MILSIVTFIIVLSILVLVHEFGHFVLARLTGVAVEEFALGLPFTNPLWSRVRKDGLRVSVYPVLFGGFVKLYGEELEGETDSGASRTSGGAFFSQGKLVRLLVIVAGVAMNVVLAVVAFSAVAYFPGVPTATNQVKVVEVTPGSPAENAGLKAGDVIVGVEVKSTQPSTSATKETSLLVGQAITNPDGFIKFIDQNRGKTVDMEINRGGKTQRVDLVPRVNPPANEGAVGVVISNIDYRFPTVPVRIWESLKLGVGEMWFWTKVTVQGVGYLVSQLVAGKVPADVSGPVGIAEVTGKVAREGILPVIELLGVLSINLAIINILPFPALDGGRAFFILVEAAVGRRVAPRVEHWIHTAGMIVLLALMLFITARDIERALQGTGIWNKVFSQ